MSGCSVSVYTDTSASHEYLCTLIQNGHEFCKLLIKRPQKVMFSNYIKKINVKNLENCEKSLYKSGRLNYAHALLMSLISILLQV